jgi:hypothetical protein
MSSLAVIRGVYGCLLAAVVQVGCVERQVGGGDTGSSAGETGTSGASGAGPTTAPNPSGPGTGATSGPGTTQTTVATLTAPTTDGPDSATDDPSGPDTATTWKLDLPDQPAQVPAGIVNGCTKQGPESVGVKGTSPLGPFFSQRAYFGYVLINGEPGSLRLLFLDETADLDLAFAELEQNSGEIITGPALEVQPSQQFSEQFPFWSGQDMEAALVVRKNGEQVVVMGPITVVGGTGNWDVPTPNDPPRVQGTIEPGGDGFTGGFDAVFCDLLVQHVIAE